MRASEFLIEAENKAVPGVPFADDLLVGINRLMHFEDAQKVAAGLAAFINKNCKPYLADVNPHDQTLYRGVRHTGGAVAFIRDVRTDREPRDTEKFRHNAFNMLIKLAGGTANRSNAAFCTSSTVSTTEYGDTFTVFPIGNFHYTWSPYFDDWTINFKNTQMRHLMKPEYKEMSDEEVQEWIEIEIAKYSRELERIQYAGGPSINRINNLKKDIENLKGPRGVEIARAMASLNYDSPNILKPEVYDLDKLKQSIIVDRYLADAIQSRHEVMISGSDILYINKTFYGQYVRDLIL